jgi:hypothetical protein
MVTPTHYQYPFGDVRRHGIKGDGSTNDASVIQTTINLIRSVGSDDLYLPAPINSYFIGTTTLNIPAGLTLRGGTA